MPIYLRTLASVLVILGVAAAAGAQGRDILPPVPTPTDIKPGSITCDECPYPAPEPVSRHQCLQPGRAYLLYGHRADQRGQRPRRPADARQQLRRLLLSVTSSTG